MSDTFAKQATGLPAGQKMLKITKTATPGDLLHTAVAGVVGDYDEISIWAMNNDTVSRLVTIEWGGVAGEDLVQHTVDSKVAPYLMVPGWRLQNGLVVQCFAAAANVISLYAIVNRIKQELS